MGTDLRELYARIRRRFLTLTILFATACLPSMRLSAAEQANDRTYSVAQAIQGTTTASSERIRVKAHFWWGKEGSMIYDSYFKAVLLLQYSDEYKRKHPSLQYLIAGTRQSGLVIATGRLASGGTGKPVFVADDLVFLPHLK